MWWIASVSVAAPQVPMEAGLHQLVALDEGVERHYTVHLPKLPARGKVPVVVALHYAGHGTPNYATPFVEQLIVPGLGDLEAIIIAPDCPGSSWTDPASQAWVLSLLDQALEDWPGDPKRVVVTGFSMGGIGTWALAATHGDRFAAAVPIAGHPRDTVSQVHTPTYAIHGREDELIPMAPSEAAIATLREAGVAAVWAPVADLTHYDTARYATALRAAIPWVRRQLR